MKQRVMKAGKAAMVATGITLAATLGIGGAGAASATAPASHIKNHAQWTVQFFQLACEIATFSSNGTFTADRGGDSGTWSGGGSSVALKWTAGTEKGFKFKSTKFRAAFPKEYKGQFTGGAPGPGLLVEGARPC